MDTGNSSPALLVRAALCDDCGARLRVYSIPNLEVRNVEGSVIVEHGPASLLTEQTFGTSGSVSSVIESFVGSLVGFSPITVRTCCDSQTTVQIVLPDEDETVLEGWLRTDLLPRIENLDLVKNAAQNDGSSDVAAWQEATIRAIVLKVRAELARRQADEAAAAANL